MKLRVKCDLCRGTHHLVVAPHRSIMERTVVVFISGVDVTPCVVEELADHLWGAD